MVAILGGSALIGLRQGVDVREHLDHFVAISKDKLGAYDSDWTAWTVEEGPDGLASSRGVSEWTENSGGIAESEECRGWNPMMDEASDPVGCLKARQYRQTAKVLAREELGEQ